MFLQLPPEMSFQGIDIDSSVTKIAYQDRRFLVIINFAYARNIFQIASAPQGEFRVPPVANLFTKEPSGLNTSTSPKPT